MKRHLLFKSLLLLCALIVGTSSSWATDTVSTLTFTSACGGSGTAKLDDSDATSGTVTWTVTSDASESTYDATSGIHYGTNGANVTYVQLTTSDISGTISQVVVNTRDARAVATVSVTVGGTAFTCSGSATATNTSANYTFTGSGSGEIVVRVARPSKNTKAIYVKSVAVTYSAQQKSANELAWSAASKAVTYSEEPYGLPTLTNPHSLAITYDSSNKSVATIDSEGNVTIKNKTGNTTISATTTGDDTYAAGTVSYTLNVTQKVIIEDGVFNFGFGPSNGGDYGSGMTQVGSGTIIENESETWTAGNVTLVVANRYAWNTDGKFVIYKKAGGANAAGSITLSCPDGKAITQIEFTGPYTGTGALSNMAANIGTYTVTSTSAIWTGAAQSISFSASNSTYINTITVTYGSTVPVTISSGSGFATLFTNSALDFSTLSSELKAYTATVSENTVTLTEVANIPANTGVVLKGTQTTHAVPVSASSSTAQGDLTGNTSAATAYNAFSGYDLYMLALNGGKAQFTLVNAGEIAAGKAFLKLANSGSGARELNVVFADDEATGVADVRCKMADGRNDFYNLNGQKVLNPTKGLYIVNGKKVIIK